MGSVISSASASAAVETSSLSTTAAADATDMDGPSQASNFILKVSDLLLGSIISACVTSAFPEVYFYRGLLYNCRHYTDAKAGQQRKPTVEASK